MVLAASIVARIKRIAAGLVVVLAAASLGAVAGYRHGLDVERGHHALAMQDAIVATFEATRTDAEAEFRRRSEETERLDAATSASRAARRAGQLDAARTARPGVALPDDSVRALNRAVAAANAFDAAANSMPDVVPVAPVPHRAR